MEPGTGTGSGTPRIPMRYYVLGIAAAAVVALLVLRNTGGTDRPAGTAPPGKVWSVEHGHWHDAP